MSLVLHLFLEQKEKILEIYPARVYTASVKVQLSTFINAYEKRKKIMVKSVDFSGKGDIIMEENKECCHKKKERAEKEYRDLINRLSRIEGQVRGIKRMVEEDVYCTDILIQVSAVNAALNSFNKVLLANHIRSCVAEDIREGKEETIDELVGYCRSL